jgi:MarR family transcriptional regulator, organic hydroperoxide resistance regulator
MGPTLLDPAADRPGRATTTRARAFRVYDPAMAEGRRVGDDTVSWQVTKLAKAHRALVGDALAELGLHLGQDLLLEQLWRHDGLSQSSLVARLGVEPPTVTKMLQRLERAGLLRRERDPDNPRLWRVFLTERGRELQLPVRDLRRQVERRLLTGLSDEDRERLIALLARVTANLREPRYT